MLILVYIFLVSVGLGMLYGYRRRMKKYAQEELEVVKARMSAFHSRIDTVEDKFETRIKEAEARLLAAEDWIKSLAVNWDKKK